MRWRRERDAPELTWSCRVHGHPGEPGRLPGDNRAVTEVRAGGGRPRGGYSRSVPGLVGALIAVIALIVGIWALSRFQHRDIPDPARTVDFRSDLATARAAAPFDVLAPRAVPPGWRATSASWDGQGPTVSWHLGFLTPAGDYVGLEQGNAPAADFVDAHTPAVEPGAPVTIDGAQWQALSTSDGIEHALVRSQGAVTTLVTGTAPMAELESFAASLSAG